MLVAWKCSELLLTTAAVVAGMLSCQTRTAYSTDAAVAATLRVPACSALALHPCLPLPVLPQLLTLLPRLLLKLLLLRPLLLLLTLLLVKVMMDCCCRCCCWTCCCHCCCCR
jgi:hypothetical protein